MTNNRKSVSAGSSKSRAKTVSAPKRSAAKSSASTVAKSTAPRKATAVKVRVAKTVGRGSERLTSDRPETGDLFVCSHDLIAQRAWEIWQREGCPEGRSVEHWLQAEKELVGTQS